jgi:hypothetical protein
MVGGGSQSRLWSLQQNWLAGWEVGDEKVVAPPLGGYSGPRQLHGREEAAAGWRLG